MRVLDDLTGADPIGSRVNPPAPREPRTIVSASAPSIELSSGNVNSRTMTDSGWGPSSPLARDFGPNPWAD